MGGSSAASSAALGFDGKWVLHPDQVAAANEVFSPRQDDYDHAELILDAYDYYTSAEGGAKGNADKSDVSHANMVNQALVVMEKRVNEFGVAEPVLRPVGDLSLEIQLPGEDAANNPDVIDALKKPAKLEFRQVHRTRRPEATDREHLKREHRTGQRRAEHRAEAGRDAAHQQQVREGPAAVERIGRQEEVEGEEDDVELDLFWILDLCCF